MARFAQYAMAATEEAIEGAGWRPSAPEEREAMVCIAPLRLLLAVLTGGLFSGNMPRFWYWEL